MSENDDKTIAKTLWSETLVEILLAALRKGSGDDEISGIIRELREKGFRRNYVVDKVRKEIDDNAARRVRMLLEK